MAGELKPEAQQNGTQKTDRQEKGQKPSMRKPREEKKWIPKTNIGKLVQMGKMSLNDIYTNSLKIQEAEIVDFLVGSKLKDEVLCIKSIQKQTKAGQRTRIKAVVIVGDGEGSIGLGVKSAKEARDAINKATEDAKCNMQPIDFGWWDRKIGAPHTVKVRGSGKCGSVNITLIPAPKGTGIIAATLPKKIFQMAGIKDVFTASSGRTSASENFAKATVAALQKCNTFYSPESWETPEAIPSPLQVYSDLISNFNKKLAI
ncbi:small subunit ribosomal protein S2e [Nematocida ausubeli]|uniref:Small ribosomal subunit protein uS5 n=1 Tax=Nematocida ausubeli (strain ATCC PRA-371 / ERTm2) TaxID=1913371 RepID=H8ZFF0_NEMA1|nr:30S ribosomal protein S5 [Nematocida ausubeli]EHY64702.1 40s ribosomal protein s2 [Nematocida ausubeli]KAI5132743.1 small subunit ribosomal protein S2e [Nematocida ausubeli]KAI5137500.1 small subunit ribosomal protein S2e [Nematocida ausubeli]KAI5146658.1 small subunit ribosomal protein S2e [Nematocida ausubeli]KAI5163090.1 small subunit ribosomal protein S2e [Nematocida ausubeli]